MKTSIFVDTGAFFALEYKRDQFHSEATAVFAFDHHLKTSGSVLLKG